MDILTASTLTLYTAAGTTVADRPLPRHETGAKDNSGQQNDSESTTDIRDSVSLSPESKKLSDATDSSPSSTSPTGTSSNEQEITDTELSELRQLKIRDQEVRAHELAHLSAAGQYAAGGASFTYKQGPDGARYAVAGEVPINLSKENSAQATIDKMQTVRRAALAPAQPSSADRQIAAQAAAMEIQARQELQTENQQEKGDNNLSPGEDPSTTQTEGANGASVQPSTPPPTGVTRQAMIAAYEAMSQ